MDSKSQITLLNSVQDLQDFQSKTKLTFIKEIEFNKASVFKIESKGFLVIPKNPFNTSIIIEDEVLLENFIAEENFPINDYNNDYYALLKVEIDSIFFALNQNNSIEGAIKSLEFLDFKTLKYEDFKRKAFELSLEKNKTKILNFILLFSKFLIQSEKDDYKWTLIPEYGGLNVIKRLVFVNNNKGKYIDLFYNLLKYFNEKVEKYDLNNTFDYYTKTSIEFQKKIK